ncbi:MAG: hypothetical protein GXX95_03440 [Methanomassiliicoccus sp.]|nr:hypothetical protein [Methanomassiliicoccus sp.]
MDGDIKELVASRATAHCRPSYRHRIGGACKLDLVEEDMRSAIDMAERMSFEGERCMAELVDQVIREGQMEERK